MPRNTTPLPSPRSNRIVVGVDGSAGSLHAVRWAVRDAVSRGVSVELIAVTPRSALALAASVVRRVGRVRERHVEADLVLDHALRVAQAVDGSSQITVDTRVEHGSAAEVLTDLPDLPAMIVVGTRGVGEFIEAVLGSTGTAVTTRAKCPVVVVKSAQIAEGPVVVGVDCTPNSEPAVAVAFEEASLRGVDLVAVHAWNDVETGSALAGDFVSQWWEDEVPQNVALSESLAGRDDDYPEVRIRRVVAKDAPIREIVREGAHAQLVVMGSRGRGGLASMLLGSTSQAVLRSVRVPVMIVPTGR